MRSQLVVCLLFVTGRAQVHERARATWRKKGAAGEVRRGPPSSPAAPGTGAGVNMKIEKVYCLYRAFCTVAGAVAAAWYGMVWYGAWGVP